MKRSQQGFTLVELAIVLVIIGLIVGGVLVGQDLIKAATINSTVSSLEKINAGATTFRDKYSGLPGDLLSTKAVEFGLSASGDANATGAAGLRDGNGLIEGGAATSTNLSGETALFWKDISAAKLVAGSYTTYGTSVALSAAVTTSTAGNYMQKTRLRDIAVTYVYPFSGRNYFYLGGIAAATTGLVTTSNAISPSEARGIDEKLDDALPTTGTVLSFTALSTADAGTTTTGTTCMAGAATPKTYNVADANASSLNCQIQIRASF